ncbi:hypothetical protein B0H16DRAFT_1458756 [Mycena metata]|uniref:Uncharacterized protein n=1 Tax=Mycena metata TaxID=1033252 RepID=A0AAD7J5Y9_9AGAR|nr:hypothetical protein B0H16DRAFT_1458756 [Mycena metata]
MPTRSNAYMCAPPGPSPACPLPPLPTAKPTTIRPTRYVSPLPHPGPPPTCPLPPLPTKKATTVQPAPRVEEEKPTPPVIRSLPAGYAFVPPSVPLTFPATYHLIPAGPANEKPRKRKDAVVGYQGAIALFALGIDSRSGDSTCDGPIAIGRSHLGARGLLRYWARGYWFGLKGGFNCGLTGRAIALFGPGDSTMA